MFSSISWALRNRCFMNLLDIKSTVFSLLRDGVKSPQLSWYYSNMEYHSQAEDEMILKESMHSSPQTSLCMSFNYVFLIAIDGISFKGTLYTIYLSVCI